MAYNILQMMCSFTTKDFWFLLSPRLKTKPGSTDKTFQLCHRVNYFYPGTALVLITGDIKKLHLSGSKDKILLLKDSTIPASVLESLSYTAICHWISQISSFIPDKHCDCNLDKKIMTESHQ